MNFNIIVQFKDYFQWNKNANENIKKFHSFFSVFTYETRADTNVE